MRLLTMLMTIVLIGGTAEAAPSGHHAYRAHAAHRTAHHRRPAVDRSGKTQVGKASYYGVHQAGEITASGKPLKPGKLTAASRTLPLGTVAKVTNRKTGRSVTVKVTDRGPYAKHRIIDVSPKAATILGMKKDGVAKVKVKPLQAPKGELASR
jgi:rare lipoprotein A